MPCLSIHLAVAKKYLEKHKEENYEDFILGSIAPDIELKNVNNYINGEFTDKNSRHFGYNFKTEDIVLYMKKKVGFKPFFEKNDINTSFLRGYFLHLICDFYFFEEYGKSDKIKDMSFKELVETVYNDYDLITEKLLKDYELDIPDQIKDILNRKGTGSIKIIDEDSVYRFIDRMSKLDLNKEKDILKDD